MLKFGLCLFLALPACGDSSFLDEEAAVQVGSATQSIVLEVESWVTHPSDITGAGFGQYVAGGVDINGDGYADAIVSAPGWNGQAQAEGRTYIFAGSERGLVTVPTWETDPTNTANSVFGITAGLGDVNGDGFGDFAVLSTLLGTTYLYLGGAQWPATTPSAVIATASGSSIAAAGDINGDGFADMIVGSIAYSGQAANEGQVRVYLGGVDGLTLGADALDPTNQANARFGSSLASAGDFNGDGFSDIAVGADGWDGQFADEGRVYIYLGSAEGLTLGSFIDPTNQASAGFGSSISGAGDVNGDGYADLLVGAPAWSDTVVSRGRAYVFRGAADGVLTETLAFVASPVDQVGAQFGSSVTGAGDVNGDGYSDIVVGVIGFDPTDLNVDAGEAILYLGGLAGLDTEVGGIGVPGGLAAGAQFGYSLAYASDVNGDGVSDVIGGAPFASGGVATEGKAFGFYGAAPVPPEEVGPQRDRQFQQAQADGTAVLRGGTSTDTISLSAQLIQEAPIGGLLAMEVEVKTTAVPFNGLELLQSAQMATGSIATVDLGELAPGDYVWRTRIIYPVGTGKSPWVTYAAQGELGADFSIAEPEIIIPEPPEEIGFYDCQIAPGRSQGSGLALFGFALLLAALRLGFGATLRLAALRLGFGATLRSAKLARIKRNSGELVK